PGMGKTTTLHNVIRQDIRDGRCVVAIDPTGDLINRILETSVSKGDMDRIVLLEVGDTKYPVPLNPLRVTQTQTLEDVVAGVLWTLHSLYAGIDEQQTATQINQTLRAIVPLLLAYPQSTPFEMINVMSDD